MRSRRRDNPGLCAPAPGCRRSRRPAPEPPAPGNDAPEEWPCAASSNRGFRRRYWLRQALGEIDGIQNQFTRTGIIEGVRVLLLSTYELGRQPRSEERRVG